MAIIRCASVRLQSLVSITDKAYKATAFDGSSAVIPKSQVFGLDYDVMKSDAYWISVWILEKNKELQCSLKKTAIFDKESGRKLPEFLVEKHKPEKINITNVKPIKDLER